MSSSNLQARSDDDDLDELDDIVERFDAGPSVTRVVPGSIPKDISQHASALPTNSIPDPSHSTSGPSPPPDELPEDFAKQLAEGMESLMRELTESSSAPLSIDDRKRQEAWEKMLIEGMNGLSADDAGPSSVRARSEPETAQGHAEEDAFQRSIRQAMEKLKDSDSTLHSDSSSATASSDPLETILSQLSSGVDDSGEDNEELQGMLETMMRQLMSKEVLYEPLKELHEKFPSYIAENATKLSAEDKMRFENQQDRVTKIIAVFEDPSYNEDDQEKGAQIVALMNEMQSFGSPPSEIMGSLPPGLEFGQDGTPNLPEGCILS